MYAVVHFLRPTRILNLRLISPAFHQSRCPSRSQQTSSSGASNVETSQTQEAPHSSDDTSNTTEDPVNESQLVSDGVTVIKNRKAAANIVFQLMQLPPENPVAWDTETTGVNPAKQSPVHNGRVICATAFAGDHVDFGRGPRLFIDCLDGEEGLLEVFKPYFESNAFKKVWHNYAFDRHVLANHDILAHGFAGDTMHMARLVNSTHTRYSLEELCSKYLNAKKRSMLDRFGAPEKLLNGSDGKKTCIPPTVDLQRKPEYRVDWINYATTDAELTHRLYFTLETRLSAMHIQGTNSTPVLANRFPDLLSLYRQLMLPFGELLTNMERYGFKVDVGFLQQAECQADSDRQKLEDSFRVWAETRSPDARYMNINSDQQKVQLFFAPCVNTIDKEKELSESKTFTIELTGMQRDRYLEELSRSEDEDDKRKYEVHMAPDGTKRKLKKDITLKGLGKRRRGETIGGWPSVSAKALRKLAGWPRANPPAYGDPDDVDMCLAIDELIEANTISTLLSTFIGPLQHWPGKDGRIHASLNLNTETGRLSSRRPNLQNQPALEKDRYKVRKAFVSDEGNLLIVADYGQLELRLLAHITKCKSMIDAFNAGGDFHSRTAVTMFEHVKRAIDRGECLLERDGREDVNPNVPILKDMFSVERRKAKTLNFSIAYGKTVQGLARDWNVSPEEARHTLRLWYKERREVQRWQRHCKQFLSNYGYVETLFGRRRHLPEIEDRRKMAHAQRAAINAPLQGSAADLVMAAMVKLHQNRILRVLGWRIVLQVHDEIILEGPKDSAEMALPVVVEVMKNPIKANMLVDLTVDAKIADSWYDAK